MHPELFEIPFIHRPIYSFGLMTVIGFLFAFFLVRRLSRNITPNNQFTTNVALYSLISGLAGARLFYVAHYSDRLSENFVSLFAVWDGGLEFYGGVAFAISVIVLYLWHHKLPMRRYLDILAIGLMLGLVFGRIGCFLNGCCFGKSTGLPWAVRFPYGSFAYYSQVYPNLERNRPDPYLELPDEFFGYYHSNGKTLYGLKPHEDLTQQQKERLKENGKYHSLPVHPTQLYSSANAALICLVLYLFRRRPRNTGSFKNASRFFSKSGCIFALTFILYGITRFLVEFVRDDNPFEFDGLTISQIISIAMIILGAVLIVVFQRIETKIVVLGQNNKITGNS